MISGDPHAFDHGSLGPALHLEIAWVYLAIPVGFGLLMLQSLVHLVSHAPSREPEADRDPTQMATSAR